jgi:hypothetical protein
MSREDTTDRLFESFSRCHRDIECADRRHLLESGDDGRFLQIFEYLTMTRHGCASSAIDSKGDIVLEVCEDICVVKSLSIDRIDARYESFLARERSLCAVTLIIGSCSISDLLDLSAHTFHVCLECFGRSFLDRTLCPCLTIGKKKYQDEKK